MKEEKLLDLLAGMGNYLDNPIPKEALEAFRETAVELEKESTESNIIDTLNNCIIEFQKLKSNESKAIIAIYLLSLLPMGFQKEIIEEQENLIITVLASKLAKNGMG